GDGAISVSSTIDTSDRPVHLSATVTSTEPPPDDGFQVSAQVVSGHLVEIGGLHHRKRKFSALLIYCMDAPRNSFGLFVVQVYATEKPHLSYSAAVNLIIVINACGIPIRAPCGYLADRCIGPLNCLIPWIGLCGILIFCWAAVHTVAELYVFAVFYGLVSAAAMALFAGTVPSLTEDLNKIGTRVGMALTLMSFGPLTGPSVAGALIVRTGGSYLSGQIWAGAALIVGVLTLVGACIIIYGPHLRVKL
ncbi:uncharacterized protein N7498_006229, partial [Penicillium cinerascens]